MNLLKRLIALNMRIYQQCIAMIMLMLFSKIKMIIVA